MSINKEDIDKIIKWCERKKAELQRTYIIERNQFKEEIPWTWVFTTIEIDRPKSIASKTGLLYDSTTKSLWRYMNGSWQRVEPEVTVDRRK
jgi:hypothetical protein